MPGMNKQMPSRVAQPFEEPDAGKLRRRYVVSLVAGASYLNR